jgi:hypothetical protein
VIEREIDRYNINITGSAETYWKGSGHFVTANGNTIYQEMASQYWSPKNGTIQSRNIKP